MKFGAIDEDYENPYAESTKLVSLNNISYVYIFKHKDKEALKLFHIIYPLKIIFFIVTFYHVY